MPYEVKTSVLKTVADGTLAVFNSAVAGVADLKQGHLAVSAGSAVRRTVETDLKVRLSTKKLSELEA